MSQKPVRNNQGVFFRVALCVNASYNHVLHKYFSLIITAVLPSRYYKCFLRIYLSINLSMRIYLSIYLSMPWRYYEREITMMTTTACGMLSISFLSTPQLRSSTPTVDGWPWILAPRHALVHARITKRSISREPRCRFLSFFQGK